MDKSNFQMLCCVSNTNKELKNVIEQQSQTISLLLEEKEAIKLQYENLLSYVYSNIDTSNIIDTSI